MSDFTVEARDGVQLRARLDGVDEASAPVAVFCNSLGTSLELWDQVVALLPNELRILRYDKRGHGRSDVPDAPYAMGTLISDAEAVIEAVGATDVTFVGLSIGGMIAQGLAVKRLDLVGRMVLSNTGAKIGTAEIWADRIAAIEGGGMEAVIEPCLQRWFGPKWRDETVVGRWRQMLLETPVQGYIGCAAAIAGTDFFATTATLRLPTLGIAGSEDGATPPDLVRETTAMVPGSDFALIRGAGHLPCTQKPREYAGHLVAFLERTGQI